MFKNKEHPNEDLEFESYRDLRDELKHFICYIKSGCVAPDFEMEVEAKSKKEAIDILLGQPQLVEYNREMLSKHVIEIKEINYNDYRN